MVYNFDSITAGILPLKLNTGLDKRELDRARYLIASLKKFWNGFSQFSLHIIALDEEFETVRDSLVPLSDARVKVFVAQESNFFTKDSHFNQTKGMYKQQLIKIFVPVALELGPFIAFDADILCIKSFDEKTFIHEGRIISTWEPKNIHSWWLNGMEAFRLYTDLSQPGLGVTPNVLHSDICAALIRYLEMRGSKAMDQLVKYAHPSRSLVSFEKESIPLAWSEYSLYHMAAEWFGILHTYHLHQKEVDAQPVRLHSRRNVWSVDSASRLARDNSDPGHFLVVQSWSGIPVEEIIERIELDLEM